MRTEQRMIQSAIAEEEGVDQATISRDLAFMAKKAHAKLADLGVVVKMAQISQLEWEISELHESWESSKTDDATVTRTTHSVIGGDDGEGEDRENDESKVPYREVTASRVHRRTGDVVYLREARAAMADIRDILGTDAPKAATLTSLNIDIQSLTDVELERIANGEDPVSVILSRPGTDRITAQESPA